MAFNLLSKISQALALKLLLRKSGLSLRGKGQKQEKSKNMNLNGVEKGL
jgi:hypothetical protein